MSATSVQEPAQSLGFSSQEEEVRLAQLPLRGEVPGWLAGSLLRVGPAKFEVGEQRLRHWFDGLAMLHRFTIDAGVVSYGSRFLESHAYRAVKESGRLTYSEFATDPCRSIFKRVQALFTTEALSDNAGINVARLGERFIAMTETPLPVEFDPETLASAAVRPYRPLGHLSTAHPHAGAESGSLLNYAAKLGPRSSYRFFEIPPQQGEPRLIASLPVREPALMHSFGLSQRWLVLAEFPLLVNPLRLAFANKPYIENYRWRPERGTRFTLIDRENGEVIGGFVSEACFAFHHVNSYEEGEAVVVDLCTYPDSGIVEDLYLDRLREGKPVPAAELTRFRLDIPGRTVSREQLCKGGLELPRINYRDCNSRPYRYVWGNDLGPSGWVEQIVRVDLRDGSRRSWSESGAFPGEPVFVPRPGAADEDDGVLLSIVLDSGRGASYLLVLDAADLRELSRAIVPHHIPFSFHGQFVES
ncbi:MAG: carotenoid oxygenase family protein [Solirubrobacterales bacterium]